MNKIYAPVFFKPGCPDEVITKCYQALHKRFDISMVHSRRVTLTEDVLKALYANLEGKEDKTLWSATLVELLGETVEFLVIVLDGEEELEELVEFIGSKTDPKKCAPESLRYRFGKGRKRILQTKYFWYYNQIHRPRTREEANAHFKTLFPESATELD